MNSLFTCSWIKNTNLVTEAFDQKNPAKVTINAAVCPFAPEDIEQLADQNNVKIRYTAGIQPNALAGESGEDSFYSFVVTPGPGNPNDADTRVNTFLNTLNQEEGCEVFESHETQLQSLLDEARGKKADPKYARLMGMKDVRGLAGTMTPRYFATKVLKQLEKDHPDKAIEDITDDQIQSAMNMVANLSRKLETRGDIKIGTQKLVDQPSAKQKLKKGETGFDTLNLNLEPETELTFQEETPMGHGLYTAVKDGLKYRVAVRNATGRPIKLKDLGKDAVVSVVVTEPSKMETISGPSVDDIGAPKYNREKPVADFPAEAGGDFSGPDPEEEVYGRKGEDEETEEGGAETEEGGDDEFELEDLDIPELDALDSEDEETSKDQAKIDAYIAALPASRNKEFFADCLKDMKPGMSWKNFQTKLYNNLLAHELKNTEGDKRGAKTRTDNKMFYMMDGTFPSEIAYDYMEIFGYWPGKGPVSEDEEIDATVIEKGTKHEMEHTKDPLVAKKIATDHLKEDPKYYDKLAKAGINGEEDYESEDCEYESESEDMRPPVVVVIKKSPQQINKDLMDMIRNKKRHMFNMERRNTLGY